VSIIPDFEIGVLNAWIFIIPLIVYWFSGIKFLFSKRMPESPPPEKRKDKILSLILVATMFISFFYSIFVPFKLQTIWFYIGLFVYLAGTFLIIISMINFATTPMDKPVTKGVYRFSRNPMFIGFFLVYLGVAIACISWVYLLMTVLFIMLVYYMSPLEEAITLEHYGLAYEEYIKMTPKWIGLPKKIGHTRKRF
jgi:protein-S-isoprenylcysteine O-methyltransferase Ste14